MRNSNVSGTKRITAGILGMLMLVIVLFSSFYISAEAEHVCSGKDCPVCACIRQCENTLRLCGDGTAAQPAAFIPFIAVFLTPALFGAAILQETPVSRKVRLNN